MSRMIESRQGFEWYIIKRKIGVLQRYILMYEVCQAEFPKMACKQSCQMVYFQTKNPNLCKFWRVLNWKLLIYFIAIWNIYRHLGYFMTIWYAHLVFIWYIFPVLVSCTMKNLATLLASRFAHNYLVSANGQKVPQVSGWVSRGNRSKVDESDLGPILWNRFGQIYR
jgi:hypothetical protein